MSIEPDEFQFPTKPLICHPNDLERFSEFLRVNMVVDENLPEGSIFISQIAKWSEQYPGWKLALSITRTAYGMPCLVECVKCGWKTDRPKRHKGKCKKRLREQATEPRGRQTMMRPPPAVNATPLIQAVKILLEMELSKRSDQQFIRTGSDGKVYRMESNGNEYYWQELGDLNKLVAQLDDILEKGS